MSAIIMIDNKNFYTESRGNKMTLVYDEKFNWWEMYTDNAAHRAYRGPGVKVFSSLSEVEKSYKSWRGISALVEGIQDNAN